MSKTEQNKFWSRFIIQCTQHERIWRTNMWIQHTESAWCFSVNFVKILTTTISRQCEKKLHRFNNKYCKRLPFDSFLSVFLSVCLSVQACSGTRVCVCEFRGKCRQWNKVMCCARPQCLTHALTVHNPPDQAHSTGTHVFTAELIVDGLWPGLDKPHGDT